MNIAHALTLILLILILKNLYRPKTDKNSEIFKVECSNKDKCLDERIGTIKLQNLSSKSDEALKRKDASHTQLLHHLKKE